MGFNHLKLLLLSSVVAVLAASDADNKRTCRLEKAYLDFDNIQGGTTTGSNRGPKRLAGLNFNDFRLGAASQAHEVVLRPSSLENFLVSRPFEESAYITRAEGVEPFDLHSLKAGCFAATGNGITGPPVDCKFTFTGYAVNGKQVSASYNFKTGSRSGVGVHSERPQKVDLPPTFVDLKNLRIAISDATLPKGTHAQFAIDDFYVSVCRLPKTNPSPTPEGACGNVDLTCKPEGFTLEYYANPFDGYSNPNSGLGPGYYLDQGLSPIDQSKTNTTYFPSTDDPNQGHYPEIYPSTSDPTLPYFVGYTSDIEGITVDNNNFTLVYSGLYKAPASGIFNVCSAADNLVSFFFAAGNAFPCGGQPSGDAPLTSDSGLDPDGDYADPSYCFNVALVSGAYYPIRLVMGNYQGPAAFGFTIAPPGASSTNDFSGLVYSPSCARATNP